MAGFKYLALTAKGDKTKGTVEAENQSSAIANVYDLGLFPIRVEADAGWQKSEGLRGQTETVVPQPTALHVAAHEDRAIKKGTSPEVSTTACGRFRRWWYGEQKKRRFQTVYFVVLGLVWMAILGYLAVLVHVLFVSCVNSAWAVSSEQARRWCYCAAVGAVTVWGLISLFLFLAASRLLPRMMGAKLAVGTDALNLTEAARGAYDGMCATAAAVGDVHALGRVSTELAIVSGETSAAGDSRLRLYVLETLACNAFAIGGSVSKGSIVVTRGLLRTLTRDELQAVLAHELAHLKNGDAMFVVQALAFAYMVVAACVAATSLAAVCAVLLVAVLQGICCAARSSGNGYVVVGTLVAVPIIAIMGFVWLCVYVVSVGIVLALVIIGVKAASSAIGQSREYLADACAVQWAPAHCPFALASALRKVAGAAQIRGLNRALAPLWLEQGGVEESPGWCQRLFSFLIRTHPPVERRLEVLREMAGSSALTDRQWLLSVQASGWQRFKEWAMPTLATCTAVGVAVVACRMDLSNGKPTKSAQAVVPHASSSVRSETGMESGRAVAQVPARRTEDGRRAVGGPTHVLRVPRVPTRPVPSKPRGEVAPSDEAMRAYWKGSASCVRGDFDTAIVECTKAIELAPQNPWAHLQRGLAYSRQGDFDKAWLDVKACQALGGRVKDSDLEALRQASGRTQ